MSYNWNRAGGERIIPISIEGGSPSPSFPGQRVSERPRPPLRTKYEGKDPIKYAPNPSDSNRPAENQAKLPPRSGYPDFRSFELDEMDSIAEALKQKRATHGEGFADDSESDRPSVKPSRNPGYNYTGKVTKEGSSNLENSDIQMGFIIPSQSDTVPRISSNHLPYPASGGNFY